MYRDPLARAGPGRCFSAAGRSIVSELLFLLGPPFDPLARAGPGRCFRAAGGSIVSELLFLLGPPSWEGDAPPSLLYVRIYLGKLAGSTSFPH